LAKDHVGEGREVEELVVDVEKLFEQVLYAMEVDCGLRVEPLEVDVEDRARLRRHDL